MKAAITVLFIALLSCSVSASDAPILSIRSGVDCGTWEVARYSGRASPYEDFVVGTLNGISYGRQIEFWSARGHVLDRETVMLYLDNYCKEHALDDVTRGVFQLFKEQTGWQPKA